MDTAASTSKVTMRSGRVAGKAADTSGRPAHHANASANSFRNPWPSSRLTWSQMLEPRLPFEPVQQGHPDVKHVQVVKPDFAADLSDTTQLHATWLGHASVLVQLPKAAEATRPVRLLFDPIFSQRASPVGFAGPMRRIASPCEVADLPTIDFVLISHNHYDHLDENSIKEAETTCAETAIYVVPLGNRSFFEQCHIPADRIIELDWWDERSIDLRDLLHVTSIEGTLRVVATPAQHNSGRGLRDQGATLWAGFLIEQVLPTSRIAVYNAGDTGYRAHPRGETCPIYKEVGELLGPIDLALIPIWRGGSLSFFSYVGLRLTPEVTTQATHCTPEDAIEVHKDVQARRSLAIHFATFAGSDDEALWPLDLLRKAKERASIPDIEQDGGFGHVDVGRTFSMTPSKRA